MKFLTEKDSIDYFVKRLESKGFTNVNPTQSENQYSYYDIESEYRGVKIRWELKRRNYLSTKFGDSICERYKFESFVDGIRNGEFDKGYLVSFFDDILTIDDITKPCDVDFIYANKTTEFANRNVVEKAMCHYKQTNKYKYEY